MSPATDAVPHWNTAARELRWYALVIRTFRNDAENQRIVLNAFQVQGWPPRLENPFPCEQGVNRKTRLQETVKNLNRGLRGQCIHFRMDGTGQTVRWEVIAQETP